MPEASSVNSEARSNFKGWLKFTLVSVVFFQITAATFTSLGVVLPFMIEEMTWSWSRAGLGFSMLSFMVGIASRLPSWTLRKFGAGTTFGAGGITMAAGHALMATTTGFYQYLTGAALSGIGYTLCALVPGVAVIQESLPHRRSFAIGAYMMIGGLGGVAGPQLVTGIVGATGSWRMHWVTMAVSVAVLAFLCMIFLRDSRPQNDNEGDSLFDVEKRSDKVYMTRFEWHFDDVVRTPQFYVIVAALTITLFGGVTTNSWAVSHMGNLGVAISIAAGAMSAHALINSTSRVFGGLLATRIDPKWLLATALAAETIGMLALSVADDPLTIVLFAIGEGYGFGMCMFATTILLINYYGPKEAPKTMGTMYLISTVAMLGPVFGGYIADTFGGFEWVFRGYAVVMLLCCIAIVGMRPPQLERVRVDA